MVNRSTSLRFRYRIPSAARRVQAVLREFAIVRRRVSLLKGTVARKRLLVRWTLPSTVNDVKLYRARQTRCFEIIRHDALRKPADDVLLTFDVVGDLSRYGTSFV